MRLHFGLHPRACISLIISDMQITILLQDPLADEFLMEQDLVGDAQILHCCGIDSAQLPLAGLESVEEVDGDQGFVVVIGAHLI